MSDEQQVKASAAIVAMIEEQEQRIRLASLREYQMLANLHRIQADIRELQAEQIRLQAEHFVAEKREFCDAAEAEIAAREAIAALEPAPPVPGTEMSGDQFTMEELEAELSNLNSLEIEYLRSFAGLGEPQPWSAAMSAIMETLAGHGMIAGESDATPTALGVAVAQWSDSADRLCGPPTDSLRATFEDDHIVERAPLIDAQTCEEVDPRVETVGEERTYKFYQYDLSDTVTHTSYGETATATVSAGDDSETVTEEPEVSTQEESGDFVTDAPAVQALPGGVEESRDQLPVGWIAHDGSESPLGPDAYVEIMYQDGTSNHNFASYFTWTHDQDVGNIVAYRAVEPAPKIQDFSLIDPNFIHLGRSSDGEQADPQSSVLDDPDFQADVARKKAMLAQGEPKPYVGCVDEELDREYDAAKAREERSEPEPRKFDPFAFMRKKEDA